MVPTSLCERQAINMLMEKLFGASALLTTRQVATREGLSVRQVQTLCNQGNVMYARKIAGIWMIAEGYFFAITPKVGKTKGMPIIVAERRPRGRPKGSSNKKPYPKGVKRPRKKV